MDARSERAGREGPEAYEMDIGDENLGFRTVRIADAIVTGRQILKAADARPMDDYVAMALLPDGSLEEIRQDDTFDLSAKGAERVVVMKADATYRFFVDDRELVWKRLATGFVLKSLAGVDPSTADLFQEVRGPGDDKTIGDKQVVDLSVNGVERFYTAARAAPSWSIVVNARERSVNAANVSYEQIVAFAFPGQHAENVVFSMTYRHAASSPHSGELGPGGVVEVKGKGTVFNVTRTVQS